MTTQTPIKDRDGRATGAQRHTYRRLIIAIAFAGCVLRLVHYLSNPSFWHDEALVVLNVMDKPAAQLVGRLDYAQAAPPLFLLLERALFVTTGGGEYSLRLVSLACGLASVVLFSMICWRTLPLQVAPWICAFFALCDKLIWHSAEVKPYSGDAFCAVLLLFIALGANGTSGAVRFSFHHLVRKLSLLSLTATLLVWFSFPSAIVFGGLSLMLLPDFARQGGRGLLIYLFPNLLVCASFALLYKFSIHPQHVDYLSSFWAKDFPPYSHPARIPVWLVSELYALCDHPYRSFGAIFFILAAAGLAGWRMLRRNDLLGACLLLLSLAVVAACLKQYPFNGDRLTIYLVPGLFLLCGGSLAAVLQNGFDGAAKLRWVVLPLAFVVVARGAGEAAYRLLVPRTWSSARLPTRFVRESRLPGDGLYLLGEPEPDRPLYHSTLNLEPLCYWHEPPPPLWLRMPDDLSHIPEQRFWLLFGSTPKLGSRAASPLLKQLEPYASEVDRFLPADRASIAILMKKKTPSPPARSNSAAIGPESGRHR